MKQIKEEPSSFAATLKGSKNMTKAEIWAAFEKMMADKDKQETRENAIKTEQTIKQRTYNTRAKPLEERQRAFYSARIHYTIELYDLDWKYIDTITDHYVWARENNVTATYIITAAQKKKSVKGHRFKLVCETPLDQIVLVSRKKEDK